MPEPGLVAVRKSLERQSLLVALFAAVIDAMLFISSGIFSAAPTAALTMTITLVAADLCLALRPSTTAAVAYIQVITRILACLLLSHYALAAGIGNVGVLVAGYRAGAWLPGRASATVLPVLMAGVATAAYLNGSAEVWWMIPAIAVSNALIPWLVGRYTAAGGAYVTKLEMQRKSDHAALAKALADEHEAIARDLHDVISHHVSAIGIHAGAARMTLGSNIEASERSLRAVETSSQAAMKDLRLQLDILHGRDDAGEVQPGLANIPELVESVGRAGLSVDINLPRGLVTLPKSLDVIVYRIVQELLTNALRHGYGSACLKVRRDRSRIVIDESNPIAAEVYTGDSLHRGLDGMRRRAELFDGRVECGADESGRWRTLVEIPVSTR